MPVHCALQGFASVRSACVITTNQFLRCCVSKPNSYLHKEHANRQRYLRTLLLAKQVIGLCNESLTYNIKIKSYHVAIRLLPSTGKLSFFEHLLEPHLTEQTANLNLKPPLWFPESLQVSRSGSLRYDNEDWFPAARAPTSDIVEGVQVQLETHFGSF